MNKIVINLVFLLTLLITATGTAYQYIVEKNSLICIDPGHGGIDSGTVGYDGTLEKDINLTFALTLADVFIDMGYSVLLTRNTDTDLASSYSKNRKKEDMENRVNIINSSGCLLYISIHANSYRSNQVYGAQVFYNAKCQDSMKLANLVQERIKQDLLNTNRSALAIKDKYLVDYSVATGVLVEIGFLSNKRELTLLKDKNYQIKMAISIVEACCEFLTEND